MKITQATEKEPLSLENGGNGSSLATTKLMRWRIVVADLIMHAHIGVYDSEQGRGQPVAMTIEVDCVSGSYDDDALQHQTIIDGVARILVQGHIKLVETLAEKVAEFCLRFEEAKMVAVSVSKPEAIKEAQASGVRITRVKQ